MSEAATQISISKQWLADEDKSDPIFLIVLRNLFLHAYALMISVHAARHVEVGVRFYGQQHNGFCINSESYAGPQYSRDGWILMSSGRLTMFFLNPVTQVVIQLPDLAYPYEYTGICFSGHPTSAECVIFGINSFCEDFVNISTIRLGDKKWSRSFLYYENNLPFFPSWCNPVFHNGLVYSLGIKGNLGVYDLRTSTWTVLRDPQKPCKIAHENYLVGCGGKLISVFLGRLGSWISVYRLDDSKMTWENVYNLEDYALFFSIPASFSTNDVLAIMKNKIFLPIFHNNYVVFYSFDTQKFQTFGSNLCTENLQQCVVSEQFLSCWIERRENFYCDDNELHWVSESDMEDQSKPNNSECLESSVESKLNLQDSSETDSEDSETTEDSESDSEPTEDSEQDLESYVYDSDSESCDLDLEE